MNSCIIYEQLFIHPNAIISNLFDMSRGGSRIVIYISFELLNQFTEGCLRCYELRCHLKLIYLHKSKFLSYYTVRYHRCYAPRYRLDVVGLLPLVAASYHTRPWQHIIQCFNGQHILQGFVEPDAMDVRVAALLYALLPQASHAVCIDEYTQI